MVEMDKIPDEGQRIDLGSLPETAELIAVSEQEVPQSERKAAGLVVMFKNRDGSIFPQKYTRVSGRVLKQALAKLGYKSTEPLFKAWHEYKMTPMRQGFPRYIPTKKVR
jgi:hypothetical protein